MATWREMSKKIIMNVIEREGRGDMKKLRKALRDAYPFGERRYHPYKVWCEEVRRHIGIRRSKANNQVDLFGV
jgi:hypothetical protein